MAKGNRPTAASFLDNEIKSRLGLSYNDIKRLEAMVDAQDYDPRVLYRDYKNDPKYAGIKSISDSYDAKTKTIQLNTPSIAIEYIKNNMPDDYLTIYRKDGKRTNKLIDEFQTYATDDIKRKYGEYDNLKLRRAGKQDAANILYDAVRSAVTTSHTTRYGTAQELVTSRIPKNTSKFIREAAAIMSIEYFKKNKYYKIK